MITDFPYMTIEQGDVLELCNVEALLFKRSSTWVIVLCGVLTQGFFGIYWLLDRIFTLNRFHPNKIAVYKPLLLIALSTLLFLSLVTDILPRELHYRTLIFHLLVVACTVSYVVCILTFRTRLATILPGETVSYGFSLMFGIAYFQFKINRRIDLVRGV